MLIISIAALAGINPVISTAEAKAINATNSNTTNIDLHISTKEGSRNETAPLLYGWMIEEINMGSL